MIENKARKIDGEGIVAHYTSHEYLDKILGNKKLKLSKVSNFDDPRESLLDWISTSGLGHNPDYASNSHAKRLKESAGQKINVLCTCVKSSVATSDCPIESAPYGKPRMWSQYGGHKLSGFCVVLDSDLLAKEMEKVAEKPRYFMKDKVEYPEYLHTIGNGITIETGTGQDLLEEDLFDKLNKNYMMRSVYFKKSKDWEDESEFRWLVFSDSVEDIFISIESCIVGVVLGLNFPIDKLDRAKEYCRELKCSCDKVTYSDNNYDLISMC